MWGALHRSGSGTIVHRSAGPEVAVAAAYARTAGRRFVYSSSSTLDWTHGVIERRADQRLFELGARMAHAVAVQSAEQVGLARALVGSHVRIAEIPSLAEPAEPADRRDYFLWAGSSTNLKDPIAYAGLARAVPEARFVMCVDGRDGSPGAVPMADLRTAAPANLELRDAVPRAELGELMRGAVAVVNTSPAEGMPNVFLEAWARGVPVLSLTVDPDGIVRRHGLGTVAGGSIQRLAAAARELWSGDDAAGFAVRTRAYVAGRHSAAAVVPLWLELLT
jgi:glycosyltransferase involved in cell wall biosynthesis